MLAETKTEEQAKKWGVEIADLVKQHGGGNMRLAIDRCNHEGIAALESHGVEVRTETGYERLSTYPFEADLL